MSKILNYLYFYEWQEGYFWEEIMMDNEEQKVNTQRKAVFHSRRTRMRIGEDRCAQDKLNVVCN